MGFVMRAAFLPEDVSAAAARYRTSASGTGFAGGFAGGFAIHPLSLLVDILLLVNILLSSINLAPRLSCRGLHRSPLPKCRRHPALRFEVTLPRDQYSTIARAFSLPEEQIERMALSAKDVIGNSIPGLGSGNTMTWATVVRGERDMGEHALTLSVPSSVVAKRPTTISEKNVARNVDVEQLGTWEPTTLLGCRIREYELLIFKDTSTTV